MANEIVALEQNDDEISVLFLFPIAVPKQIGTLTIVPSPSTTLPDIANAVLTAGEKSQLDAGTLAFATMTFKRNGISGAALLSRVQNIYALALNKFTNDYNNRYALSGNRYSA